MFSLFLFPTFIFVRERVRSAPLLFGFSGAFRWQTNFWCSKQNGVHISWIDRKWNTLFMPTYRLNWDNVQLYNSEHIIRTISENTQQIYVVWCINVSKCSPIQPNVTLIFSFIAGSNTIIDNNFQSKNTCAVCVCAPHLSLVCTFLFS